MSTVAMRPGSAAASMGRSLRSTTPTGRANTRSASRGPATLAISFSSLGPTPDRVRISANRGKRIEGRIAGKHYGRAHFYSIEVVLGAPTGYIPPHDGP